MPPPVTPLRTSRVALVRADSTRATLSGTASTAVHGASTAILGRLSTLHGERSRPLLAVTFWRGLPSPTRFKGCATASPDAFLGSSKPIAVLPGSVTVTSAPLIPAGTPRAASARARTHSGLPFVGAPSNTGVGGLAVRPAASKAFEPAIGSSAPTQPRPSEVTAVPPVASTSAPALGQPGIPAALV